MTLTHRQRILAAIAATVVIIGAVILAAFVSPSPAQQSASQPVITLPPAAPVTPQEPATAPDAGSQQQAPSVDLETLDIEPMNLEYEALALVSAYYSLDGEPADRARFDAVVENASTEVAQAFDDRWDVKQAFATEYPNAVVFIEPRSISDVPTTDGDVAVAILLDVYQSLDGEDAERVATARWKVSFEVFSPQDVAPNTANWRISSAITTFTQ